MGFRESFARRRQPEPGSIPAGVEPSETSLKAEENQCQIAWCWSAFGSGEHRDAQIALIREHCALVAFAHIRELHRAEHAPAQPASVRRPWEGQRIRSIVAILAAGEALIASEEVPPAEMLTASSRCEREDPRNEVYWETAIRRSMDAIARHQWLDHLAEHAIHYAQPWSCNRFAQVSRDTPEIRQRLASTVDALVARTKEAVMNHMPRSALPLSYVEARAISADLHRIHAYQLLNGRYPDEPVHDFCDPARRAQYLGFIYPTLSSPPPVRSLAHEAARQCCEKGLNPEYPCNQASLRDRFDWLTQAETLRSVPDALLDPAMLLRAMGSGRPDLGVDLSIQEHGEKVMLDTLPPAIHDHYRRYVKPGTETPTAMALQAAHGFLARRFAAIRSELPTHALENVLARSNPAPEPELAEAMDGPNIITG